MMRSDSIKARLVLPVCLGIGLVAVAHAQLLGEPFFPVGVVYHIDPAVKPEQVLSDLQRIRDQGFNVLRVSATWPPSKTKAAGESADHVARLLDAAARADLEVITDRENPADRLFESRSPVYASSALTGPQLRLWAWAAMAYGARAVIFAEPSAEAAAFARVVTRNSALFDPLRPRASTADVRIEGGNGAVEARFLESSDVLMLIAFNNSGATHRVTMAFAPDTQEAIWQNMETGTSVNFLAGPKGPTYTHRFAPYDVLVLMIRKAIR
jgi:hypothetical protein